MLKVSELIAKITKDLSARQKEVLEGRFGLKNGSKKTLAAIGTEYGITRERVRQIEAEALKSVAKNFRELPKAEIIEVAEKHIKSLGGVRRADYLVEDLKTALADNSFDAAKINFVFEVAARPLCRPEDDDYSTFYYLDEKNLKNVADFISRAYKFFANKKEFLISHNKLNDLISELAKNDGFKDTHILNILSVSKKFGKNAFGDFGLSHWEEINPKTTRARAYLVIKKYNKPLHFKEITDLINKHKLSKKTVYHQTVHNELIKDSRFVLVGRGTYALQEHGYEPGATKELIAKIIKSNGPLSSREVVEAVKRQRFLKENTILINLQNKKHFKRTGDGRYQLA